MKAGFALDMKPNGFGLIPLSYHAKGVYVDPLTDNLYLALDAVDEPDDVYLPEPSTAPTPNGSTIYQFDSIDGDGRLVYRWRGKLNLLPRPAAFQYARVRAEDYDNLVLRLYGDGVLIFDRVVTSGTEFTLPTLDEYNSAEIELIGTSRVRTVVIGESVEELT